MNDEKVVEQTTYSNGDYDKSDPLAGHIKDFHDKMLKMFGYNSKLITKVRSS